MSLARSRPLGLSGSDQAGETSLETPPSINNVSPYSQSPASASTRSRRIPSSSSSNANAIPLASSASTSSSRTTRARSSSRSTGMKGSVSGNSKFEALFGKSSPSTSATSSSPSFLNGMSRRTSASHTASSATAKLKQYDPYHGREPRSVHRGNIDDEDDDEDDDPAPHRPGSKAKVDSSAHGKKGSKKAELLRCERCHKVYHHPQSLIKHRWQHTEIWNSASSYGLSKHATVQALEAAVILSNPEAVKLLPEDKSHWPAAVSPAASGLLGSDRINLDLLSKIAGGSDKFKMSRSLPVKHSRLGTSLDDDGMTESESLAGDEGSSVTSAHPDDDDDAETSSDDDLGAINSRDIEIDRMDLDMAHLDLDTSSSPAPTTLNTRHSNARATPYPVSNLTSTRAAEGSYLYSIPSSATISLPHSHSRVRSSTSEEAGEASERRAREASDSSSANTASLSSGEEGSYRYDEERRNASHSGSETKDSGYASGSVLATSVEKDSIGVSTTMLRDLSRQADTAATLIAPGGHVSMSAPVLGFFTEEPQMRSPSNIGPARTAGPQMATSPRLAPYRSPSLRPQHVGGSDRSSPRLYPLPSAGPPRLPSSLLRSPSFQPLSLGDSATSAPKARPDPPHSLSRSPYSFGQAPLQLGSSFRSSSLSRSFGQALHEPIDERGEDATTSKREGLRTTPAGDEDHSFDKSATAEQDEELMDMDL